MPDRTKLKIGDRIKLICVPAADLQQRERELREGTLDDPGVTANTIAKIIHMNPIVKIIEIDEWGYPWYRRKIGNAEHSIAIMDDDSWTFA
jgi:hypothetical protein